MLILLNKMGYLIAVILIIIISIGSYFPDEVIEDSDI